MDDEVMQGPSGVSRTMVPLEIDHWGHAPEGWLSTVGGVTLIERCLRGIEEIAPWPVVLVVEDRAPVEVLRHVRSLAVDVIKTQARSEVLSIEEACASAACENVLVVSPLAGLDFLPAPLPVKVATHLLESRCAMVHATGIASAFGVCALRCEHLPEIGSVARGRFLTPLNWTRLASQLSPRLSVRGLSIRAVSNIHPVHPWKELAFASVSDLLPFVRAYIAQSISERKEWHERLAGLERWIDAHSANSFALPSESLRRDKRQISVLTVPSPQDGAFCVARMAALVSALADRSVDMIFAPLDTGVAPSLRAAGLHVVAPPLGVSASRGRARRYLTDIFRVIAPSVVHCFETNWTEVATTAYACNIPVISQLRRVSRDDWFAVAAVSDRVVLPTVAAASILEEAGCEGAVVLFDQGGVATIPSPPNWSQSVSVSIAGALERSPGWMTALRAFASAVRKCRGRLSLTWFCEPRPRSTLAHDIFLEACQELGVRDRVRVNYADPARLLSETDIAVAFNNTPTSFSWILTAMAAGKAVIVPNVPLYARLVEHGRTGFRYQRGGSAISSLAESVTRLCDEPVLRNRLGEAARAHVEREHSISAAATEWQELYQSVATQWK